MNRNSESVSPSSILTTAPPNAPVIGRHSEDIAGMPADVVRIPSDHNVLAFRAYSGPDGSGRFLGTFNAARGIYQNNGKYFMGVVSPTAEIQSIQFTPFSRDGSSIDDLVFATTNVDRDNDGINDAVDKDDDNDGIADAVEIAVIGLDPRNPFRRHRGPR